MMKYVILGLILIMSLGITRTLSAQVALNAPPDDPVYHAIDILVAHDLVRDVIYGQRPFSRLEIARILRDARKSWQKISLPHDGGSVRKFNRMLSRKQYIHQLLTRYEKEYAVELDGMRAGFSGNVLGRLDMGLLYNGSPARTIPWSNGQGTIDGVVTSFDRYKKGLTYVHGPTAYLETQHDFYLTPYLALTAQPLFVFQVPRSGDDREMLAQIHRLYLKSGVGNFEFEIGRDDLLWGQGEFGGLFASGNPRPLDMIKLSNPYPLKIPYVGGMKFTLFVSNLGPEQEPKYPYFYGVKWSWRPARYFEFALSHTIVMGGDGAPKVKWYEPITELMPFHKWGKNINYDDIANNAWGFFEFRVTIPQLRGLSLYYEGYIEDSIVRTFSHPDNLLNQLGFVAGVYMPRLTNDGDLGLRLEYHHLPPLAYRHSTWSSGYTLNRRVIGDPLGPDADGLYATLYWRPTPRWSTRFSAAFEDYDSSLYATEARADGGGDRIFKIEARPHERRYRFTAETDVRTRGRLGYKLAAGYERITNWNFEVGTDVNNIFLMGRLSLFFDDFAF